MLRLHEASGGNPFYALEIARALGAESAVRDPTQPLPVPERLEELVSARLDGFTGATHEALVLASAHGRLTVAELGLLGVEQSALEPAVAGQVIELEHGTVRFTHPLLASVLYQGLSADERQRAHRRLAELVEDPVARARHLALSTDEPDAELAAALERGRGGCSRPGCADRRGGARRARASPDAGGDRADADRRALPGRAQRISRRARSSERALSQASSSPALGRHTSGPRRSLLMAEVESEEPRRAIPLLNEALLEADAQSALAASIHQRLSLIVRFTEGLAAAERHARASVEVAERLDDAALRAAALGGLALIRFNAGKPGALRLAEQACELVPGAASSAGGRRRLCARTHSRLVVPPRASARPARRASTGSGASPTSAWPRYALWYLAHVELRSGHLALAGDYAEQARNLSSQYARDEAEVADNVSSRWRSWPPTAATSSSRASSRSRSASCAELHGTQLCAPCGDARAWSISGAETPRQRSRGFAAAERIAAAGAGDGVEPSMCWWRAEQVEALLELGLVDDAVCRLDAWEADGATTSSRVGARARDTLPRARRRRARRRR